MPSLKVHSAKMGGGAICSHFEDDSVRCWGNGLSGQLLLDNGFVGGAPAKMGDLLIPIDFGAARYATYIGGTSWGKCAILDNSTTKCWGELNTYGNLGYGDTLTRTRPTSEVVDFGTGKVPVKIAGGMYFSCALFSDQTVKCWGRNDYGQLGYGDTNSRGDQANEMGDNLPVVDFGNGLTVKDLFVGSYHACVILNNDKVKCWGNGANGRLGYENLNNKGAAAGQMGDNLPFVDFGAGRTVKKMSLGSHQGCVILDNDKIKCWGRNWRGVLGIGGSNALGDQASEMGDNLAYIDVGTNRTSKELEMTYNSVCTILDDDTVKCWGGNEDGQLGYGDLNDRGDQVNEMGDNLPVVDLGTGLHAVSLFSHSNSTNVCAILNNGDLKCWGHNGYGKSGGDASNAGFGDAPNEMGDHLLPVNLGTEKQAVMMTGLYYGTCVLLNDKTTRCWGANNGALGLKNLEIGNDPDELSPQFEKINSRLGSNFVIKEFSVGYTACALSTDNILKCWGYNGYGALGLGHANAVGRITSEMGDNLPAVNPGTGRTVQKIFNHGAYHVCALLDDQSLKCWGYNNNGQLGYGNTTNRGDNINEMGDNLPVVNLGTGRAAKDVVLGLYHTCAILDNGSTKCWGYSNNGQLGYGDTNTRGDQINEMGDNLPAINLGTGRTAIQIATGTYHTCALLDDGSVKCWGYNNYGQLGYEDINNRGDQVNEMGDNLPAVNLGAGRTAKSIHLGPYFSCAVLDNDDLKCWGRNQYGQLGQEDTISRGTAAGQMGDNLKSINLGAGKFKEVITAATSDNVCVITASEELKCWGNGYYGVLGRGSETSSGGQPGQMGNKIPKILISF